MTTRLRFGDVVVEAMHEVPYPLTAVKSEGIELKVIEDEGGVIAVVAVVPVAALASFGPVELRMSVTEAGQG